MRKHYIDNLRTIMILLLIPYHTFMIWNNYGTKFYVWGGDNNIFSSLITLAAPWFMPVLFVAAGISARYSLKKRSFKQFITERIEKLLLPLVFGLVLLVPIQTLYARKFFFAYDGGVLENLGYFFTHFTDLNGYDGCFTFGHLWFLLYLFLISLISLIFIKYIPYDKAQSRLKNLNIVGIISLFVLSYAFYHIGNFGGQSIGKYLFLYLVGYYLFSDEFIEKLVKHKALILSLFAVSQLALTVLYFKFAYYGDLLVNFTGWLGILSWFIVGRLHLNKTDKISCYFRKSSFAIYILHQTVLVAVGYYVLNNLNSTPLSVLAIITISLALTLACCEIMKRIPYLRKLIGIK